MNKKKILSYTEEAMEQALTAVKNGMPVATASRSYNVPRTTLYYKKTGKYPEKRKMGPSTYLSPSEEDGLVTWVLHMSKCGFPITKEQLLDSVEMIVSKLEKITPFANNRPGRHWYEAFLRRHQELSVRMSQNLTTNRANVTEENIRLWFREVEAYLTENNFCDVVKDPSRVFNTDETAFFLNPKGSKVLARKGDKAIYSRSGDEKECLTTLITGNARGNLAPPMVVWSYERIPSYISSSMPKDWGIGKSENGWMTGETFFMFITNIFHPWLKKTGIKLPIILFVDGHSSHLTLPLSEFCNENGIILIALYPNSTHILQPMDVAVFHTLKSCWKKEVIKWRILNSQEKLKKEHFSPLLNEVLKKTITPEILANGFRACGLYPLNSNAIDYKKYIKNVTNSINDAPEDLQQSDSNECDNNQFREQLNKAIGYQKLKYFQDSGNIWEGNIEDTSLFHLWFKYNKPEQAVDNAYNNPLVLNEGDYILEADWLDEIMNNDQFNNAVQDVDLEKLDPPVTEEKNQKEQEKIMESGETRMGDDMIKETNANSIIQEENKKEKNRNGATAVVDIEFEEPNAYDNENEKVKKREENDLNKFIVGNIIDEIIHKIIENEIVGKEPLQVLNKEPTTQESPETVRPSIPANVPSPFKTLLFWPEPPKSDKKKRVKVKLPSVASSEQWQTFHKKTLEDKQKLEREKMERKRQREEKANEKENIKKKKIQKKGVPQKSTTNTKKGVESKQCEKNNQTLETSLSERGSYVIINYEGEHYPGKILETKADEVHVTVMERSGPNGWKWPQKPDILWYKKEDVIMAISQPKKINNRGVYNVNEMKTVDYVD